MDRQRPAGLLLAVLLGLTLGIGCESEPNVEVRPPIDRDLDAIKARDTLVVLTQFNSTSYFLYRGEPMGYEYELLQWFAREHDLHLKTHVVRHQDSLFVLLNEGVGDVVAARLTPTTADSAYVGFARPLHRTRPVVVQRARALEEAHFPQAVESLVDSAAAAPPYDSLDDARGEEEQQDRTLLGRLRDEISRAFDEMGDTLLFRARLITRPPQLSGEEVHVLDDTRAEERLVELSDRITGDIYIVEVDSGTAEMLMREVAEERIDYTVGHENVAALQESYYSNLAILPTIDRPYEVAWAVRKNAPDLREALNAWIEHHPSLEAKLYQKYYIDRQGYRERIADAYLTSETGKLSPYDGLFKRHAPGLGWNWRLLAAQAFQESRFKPRARSWAGAMGLLQLMPATARQHGVADAYDPETNVDGAARHLAWLHMYWEDKIPDPRQRLKFILASYNAGHGHVQDARRLTTKHGGDPTLWKDVAYWLLRKSEKAVYTDPVVRYGFCRGLEPVTYVSRILDRFDHYLQFVEPSAPAESRFPS